MGRGENNCLRKDLPPSERLIVALDFNTAAEAEGLIRQLDGAVNFYKVGWQLFIGEGWPFVRRLLEQGRKVFLDLKIHDIDNTVRAALANMPAAFAGGLEFLTLHGNAATVAAARQGRRGAKPRLLMLTLLSSMDAADLDQGPAGAAVDLPALVKARAKGALDAGCEGLIASGESVKMLREQFLERDFVIVTPGIRPQDAGRDEHKRALTPQAALRYGADYLVVGRPIARAADPLAMARAIIADIAAATGEKPDLGT